MVSLEDFLWFVDQELDGMVSIVRDLGDDLANRRMAQSQSSSPYAILTHCVGLMNYWTGALIAGRTVQRDRDAEFSARGTVAALVSRTIEARRQLELDLEGFDPSAPLRFLPPTEFLPGGDTTSPLVASQGGALLHVYQELAQHHGQMQICRDALLDQSV